MLCHAVTDEVETPSPYIPILSIVCPDRVYATLYPMQLMYVIAVAPLVVAAACGMGEGFQGVSRVKVDLHPAAPMGPTAPKLYELYFTRHENTDFWSDMNEQQM